MVQDGLLGPSGDARASTGRAGPYGPVCDAYFSLLAGYYSVSLVRQDQEPLQQISSTHRTVPRERTH